MHAACMQTDSGQEKSKQATSIDVARDTGYLDTIIPVPELQKIIKEYYIDPAEYSFAMYATITLPKMVDSYRCAIAISPDGNTIATGNSASGEINTWNDNGCTMTNNEYDYWIESLGITNDGIIAIQHTKHLTLRKPDNSFARLNEAFSQSECRFPEKNWSMNRDTIIFTTNQDSFIQIWKKNSNARSTLRPRMPSHIESVSIAPSGTIIAMINNIHKATINDLVVIWNNGVAPDTMIDTGKHTHIAIAGPHDTVVTSYTAKAIDVDQDITGKYIITRVPLDEYIKRHAAKVWKHDGTCIHELSGHTGQIVSIAANNDTIITAAKDHSIKIWKNGICICTLPFAYDKNNESESAYTMTKIAIAEEGSIVARCSTLGITCIWKPTSQVFASLNNLSLEQLAMLQKLLPELQALRLQQPQGELKLSDEQLTLCSKLHLPDALQQQINQFYQTNFERQRKDRLDQLHKQQQEQQALRLKLQQEAAALAEVENKQRATQAGKKEDCCIQ